MHCFVGASLSTERIIFRHMKNILEQQSKQKTLKKQSKQKTIQTKTIQTKTESLARLNGLGWFSKYLLYTSLGLQVLSVRKLAKARFSCPPKIGLPAAPWPARAAHRWATVLPKMIQNRVEMIQTIMNLCNRRNVRRM